MDISVPITAADAFWALVGFSLLGWNLLIQSQKKSISDKLDGLGKRLEKMEQRIEDFGKTAWTREEHKEFRVEVISLIDKMSDSLTGAVNRLSDRLERLVEDKARE